MAGGVAGPTVQFGMPQVNQQRDATTTGRVTCSDTQRAARFATVTLSGPTGPRRQGVVAVASGLAAADRANGFGWQLYGAAAPGDYYVTATPTGYVSLVAEAAARLRSGASAADPLATLSQAHVAEAAGERQTFRWIAAGLFRGSCNGTTVRWLWCDVSVQSVNSAAGGCRRT